MRGSLKKKLLAVITATAMAVMMMAGIVSAGTTYTPVAGTSCAFNKYLIVEAGEKVPTVTFSFTATPGTGRSISTSSNDVMEVLPGVGTPVITDVTFGPGDSTTDVTTDLIDIQRAASDRAAGATPANGVELESGEVFATKEATVSFAGITFPEPGIYRYIIAETQGSASGVIYDNDQDRVLDVYVTDDGTGTLVVSAYVLHTDDDDVAISSTMGSNDVQAAGEALADKTDGFTNEYNSKDLKVEKEVTGNQASRDKYFAITVKTTNANASDSFIVSLDDDNDANTNDGNADATSGTNAATISDNAGKTNPQTVSGSELNSGVTFYLQHGQSVVIRGLAPSIEYEVTENAEDYQSAVKSGDTNSGVIGTVAGNDKMAVAGFTNTRSGVIPTGIILSATGLIVVALIVVFGIVFFAVRSRKRYEEE
ncbi:MAG: hypothetical protein J5517_01530 [Eubacterium sp.]|nr:hypothetical protein [Eubacterium sp.]